jgi:geranylgeranyl diphosphate synthase type II
MILPSYRDRFEKKLLSKIEAMGPKSALRDACSYALMSGGKRLRPAIVLMIGDALGVCDVFDAAFSVECFHTASLIADDLPSMDNDSLRRGIPSLHKAFGEATAILASYTLIAAGYGGIYECSHELKKIPSFSSSADFRAMECLKVATHSAGLQGATQGQFFDLFPLSPTLDSIRDMIYKKTVTLFEIAFVFGWILGGGNLKEVSTLHSVAYHFGMAFQIADDLDDGEEDKRVNIVSFLGRKKAISSLEEEIASLETSLKALHLWTPSFQELHEGLASRCSLFA